MTTEARVARLPSLGAALHVSLENRAHNPDNYKTVSVSHPAAWVTLDRI